MFRGLGISLAVEQPSQDVNEAPDVFCVYSIVGTPEADTRIELSRSPSVFSGFSGFRPRGSDGAITQHHRLRQSGRCSDVV